MSLASAFDSDADGGEARSVRSQEFDLCLFGVLGEAMDASSAVASLDANAQRESLVKACEVVLESAEDEDGKAEPMKWLARTIVNCVDRIEEDGMAGVWRGTSRNAAKVLIERNVHDLSRLHCSMWFRLKLEELIRCRSEVGVSSRYG